MKSDQLLKRAQQCICNCYGSRWTTNHRHQTYRMFLRLARQSLVQAEDFSPFSSLDNLRSNFLIFLFFNFANDYIRFFTTKLARPFLRAIERGRARNGHLYSYYSPLKMQRWSPAFSIFFLWGLGDSHTRVLSWIKKERERERDGHLYSYFRMPGRSPAFLLLFLRKLGSYQFPHALRKNIKNSSHPSPSLSLVFFVLNFGRALATSAPLRKKKKGGGHFPIALEEAQNGGVDHFSLSLSLSLPLLLFRLGRSVAIFQCPKEEQ